METFDVEAWRQVLIESLSQLGGTVATFLPSLLATLLILAIGWLVSKAVEAIASRTLHRFGLDEAGRRVRLEPVLERAGISRPPSKIVARLLFWILMLTFVLSAVETLGLEAVTATIDRLISFLPNLIASGLILVLGLLFARFVRTLVGSAAAAANLDQAARLGAAAESVTAIVATVLALQQLGIDTSILVTLIALLLGSVSITLGVTFALGARPVVSHILAGHFLRQSLPVGESVEVGGRRGSVERVGAVDTLLSDGQRRWSVPNSKLLEEEVVR